MNSESDSAGYTKTDGFMKHADGLRSFRRSGLWAESVGSGVGKLLRQYLWSVAALIRGVSASCMPAAGGGHQHRAGPGPTFGVAREPELYLRHFAALLVLSQRSPKSRPVSSFDSRRQLLSRGLPATDRRPAPQPSLTDSEG